MLIGHRRLVADRRARFSARRLADSSELALDLEVIKPVNDRLMQTDLAAAGPGTRSLLQKWDPLHGERTLFGTLSIIAFLFAVSAN